MMSKAELARKADVTVQTIDRIEKGNDCRLDTKRKIILTLLCGPGLPLDPDLFPFCFGPHAVCKNFRPVAQFIP